MYQTFSVSVIVFVSSRALLSDSSSELLPPGAARCKGAQSPPSRRSAAPSRLRFLHDVAGLRTRSPVAAWARPTGRVQKSLQGREAPGSRSAIANPSLATPALQPFRRHRSRAMIQQHAVRCPRSPADTAAKLVQLREAEPLRVLHQHHRGIRHIHAHLHHGGRHQDMDLAGREGVHCAVLGIGFHAPVQQRDAVGRKHLGLQVVRHLGSRLQVDLLRPLDERIDDVHLAARVELVAIVVDTSRGDSASPAPSPAYDPAEGRVFGVEPLSVRASARMGAVTPHVRRRPWRAAPRLCGRERSAR